MKRQFFTGNTLEQAVLAAARQIGVEPERVAFKQREKKHGFLKVRRRVVIEVDMESPVLPEGERSVQLSALPSGGPPSPPPLVKDPSPSTPVRGTSTRGTSTREASTREASTREASTREASTREASIGAREMEEPPEIEEEELPPPSSESEAVRRALEEILRFLRLEAEISLHRDEEGFGVELSGEDTEVLTRDEGQVLQSMEYLVPRMVRGWLGHGVPVKVDCEGFRESRAAEIEELAARVAEEVLRDGTSQILDPMSPADRRLVHLALAEHPGVETESEGDGYYKRVRISRVTAPDLDDSLSFGNVDDFDDPSEEGASA